MFVFLGPEPLRSLEAADYEIVASGPKSVEFRDEQGGCHRDAQARAR